MPIILDSSLYRLYTGRLLTYCGFKFDKNFVDKKYRDSFKCKWKQCRYIQRTNSLKSGSPPWKAEDALRSRPLRGQFARADLDARAEAKVG